MTLRETPETMAASLRRAGFDVQPPARDMLREQLEETLRRMQAGDALDEISRRDPEAMCALATQRALTEHEALMLLGRVEYLDTLLQAAARERDAQRSWSRRQQENAELWGRSCAELGRVTQQIAEAFGEPSLARDPAWLSEVVCRYITRMNGPNAYTFFDRLGEAFGVVASERYRRATRWAESTAAGTGHALTRLRDLVGVVERGVQGNYADAALLFSLVQVAAMAVAWIESLLPIQENAAAGGAATQNEEAPIGRDPARTGLPRDATTAALTAASEELTELRKAMRLLSQTIGEPALEQEPERLAHLVNEHFECLRTERMPDEPELRALVRDAAGLAPVQLGRLRQFAQLMERDSSAVEEGLLELAGDALGRSMPASRPSSNDNEAQGAPHVDVEAREALRELLSMALGVAVPLDAPIEPRAVVRQIAAQWQRETVAAQVLDASAPTCPCSTDAEDPGPHIASCPWADPDYEDPAPGVAAPAKPWRCTYCGAGLFECSCEGMP